MVDTHANRPIVVAGHICLDVIPRMSGAAAAAAISPGALIHVGEAIFATGGPVSNTGLALHRLGVATRLAAKVGDDAFGQQVQAILKTHGQHLAAGLAVDPQASTSYTIVISPPGVDRTFLHHPGANQSFSPEDVGDELISGAGLLHFGYPPLMRQFYADGCDAMIELFTTAHKAGVATSLDTCGIDLASEAGRVDWRKWLEGVMPHTDVFCPSLDELMVMLGHEHEDRFNLQATAAAADELLGMGAGIIAIKLGDHGLYLRCADETERLKPLAHLIDIDAWQGVERYSPCFVVEVAGTTGAGDSTIAGLLAAISQGHTPQQAVRFAVAVGACSVEVVEAVNGVPAIAQVQARLTHEWPQRPVHSIPSGWSRGDQDVWERR